MPVVSTLSVRSSAQTRIVSGVLALLIITAAVGWVYFPAVASIFLGEKLVSNAPQERAKNNEHALVAAAALDSDGDGLKDWEETLFQTDQKNPDTDGDGTDDGAETRANRNPMVAGPNDQFEQITYVATDEGMKTENITFRFAQDILSNGIFSVIGTNREITSTDLLENIKFDGIQDPAEILKDAATITVSDISTGANSDPKSTRDYFNAVYSVYERYLVPLPEDDLAVLMRFASTNDSRQLEKLDQIIRAFDASIREIRKIVVPNGYENFAVAELNYLLQTKRAIEIFRGVDTDPLATALILRRRIELLSEIRDFHQQQKQILEARGVTFVPGEGGYKFFE